MIRFQDEDGQALLCYIPEQSGPTWVDDRLKTKGEVTFARTFTLRSSDQLSFMDNVHFYEDYRYFSIGMVVDRYRKIRKEVLDLQHDLLIDVDHPLKQETFTAERNISVFRRIDELIDEQISIGGERDASIPTSEFNRLLKTFPTSTELAIYAGTRITRVLGEYFTTMSDAEQRLTNPMKRRGNTAVELQSRAHGRVAAASELELEKLTYIRTRLAEMLKVSESYSEAEWQTAVADLFLLIFPQYMAVLQSVHIREHYSNEMRASDRYIDLMLVGVDGCVDMIEIKKPFERGLVSKSRYRDNHVPVRELSGSIMQAEKYLFYLSKSGQDVEQRITEGHSSALPTGLEIRIANPKAFVLAGRDDNLSSREKFDLEFIRREYSNVVDIISYDYLLRRLANSIAAISERMRYESVQIR